MCSVSVVCVAVLLNAGSSIFSFSWWFYGDLVGDAADFNSWIIQMALISSAPCVSFTNMSELVRHANPKTVSVNESLFGVKRVFFLCFVRYKNALHCFWLESPVFQLQKIHTRLIIILIIMFSDILERFFFSYCILA